MPTHKGFTLIELLVVISIITIISTIAYVNFKGTQDTGRDAARKQDLKAIATTLLSYYQDNNIYPGSVGTNYTSTSDTWIPSLVPNYIQKLPRDVKAGNVYLYRVTGATRTDFELWAILDNPNDKEAVGKPAATCNLAPPPGGYNFCIESPK